ncbi:LLM class flavin-dependent oxidoreductase [Acrocarpospora catenulata]|uniref:LLM class flavin-dependent oxidoreductase n=1 Tax=Acrocarpospora catenulata TaxID=2836182 RepID=UPI001BD9F6DB|nr:LLM class flavin-dependent oxidoreductase [Acrocarpospora catenulata]
MENNRLSVLELVTVGEGSSPGEALRGATELAQRAEEWGYFRIWVAEHHGMPGVASSSPAVIIAHLAAATRTIRVGSGGVMLPNHAPLVIAEQFGTLHALHPGRIDLGLGRAPGTDLATAHALRRSAHVDPDEFPQQVAELTAFLDGTYPSIQAIPRGDDRPPIWLLGSSGFSARLAGLLGLPFAFAHHFSAVNTEPALEIYRTSFRPSEALAEPYAMIGVSALAAETEEEARRQALPGALAFLRMRHGRPGRFPTPEEAAAYPFTAAESEFVYGRLADVVYGDPDQVRTGLDELRKRTGADELMITTTVHGVDTRLRSYELIARAYEMTP